MNKERYVFLVNVFKAKKYAVNPKTFKVINVKKQKELKYQAVKGYLGCTLCYDGKQKLYTAHEVVSVWFGKYIVNMNCNFIDGNKKNISLDNLFWLEGAKRIKNKKKSKLSKDDLFFIRDFPRFRGCLEILANEFNISKNYVNYIRTVKNYRDEEVLFRRVKNIV